MENNKKKIVVFSGAGLDRESGLLTFRDCKDGMWNNYKINEVATPQGWYKDKTKVLDFYNQRRRELPNAQPNEAHRLLVELEKDFEVTHVTQNVSDLLERAGASTVYHLHGELTKARTSFGMNNPVLVESLDTIDIGYNDINVGDNCPEGIQLRPNIVWFGEHPFKIGESYGAIHEADILVIIGTSLEITYTIHMLMSFGTDKQVFYIDPSPSRYLDESGMNIKYIKKGAAEGISKMIDELNYSEA